MSSDQTTIIITNQKSPGTAALLGFFFGPIGMLYSTVSGAVIMFFISLFAAIFTLGFGLLVTIPICSIWAYLAAKSQNNAQVNVVSNKKNTPNKEKQQLEKEELFD